MKTRHAISCGIALVALAAALALRACSTPEPNAPAIVHVPPAVPAAQDSIYARVLASVMDERDGLRGALQRAENRLRGHVALRPDTVFRVDTVLVPDTIAGIRAIAPSGRADIRVYTRADSIGYRPSYYGVDVSSCDRGLVVGAEGVVCAKAPLGHLSLFLRGELSSSTRDLVLPEPRGQVGVSWQRSFRSSTVVEVAVDHRAHVAVGVRLGLRVF